MPTSSARIELPALEPPWLAEPQPDNQRKLINKIAVGASDGLPAHIDKRDLANIFG